jgi:hypothetical protein
LWTCSAATTGITRGGGADAHFGDYKSTGAVNHRFIIWLAFYTHAHFISIYLARASTASQTGVRRYLEFSSRIIISGSRRLRLRHHLLMRAGAPSPLGGVTPRVTEHTIGIRLWC